MLNLIFQKAKAKDVSKVRVDARAFFAREKKAEWFADPFVQQVMQTVDHAEQIVNSDMYFDEKYDALDDLYNIIYDDAGDDIYDEFYDGILNDMYDDFRMPVQQPIVKEKKIYPNDPCPCGSGKKYKKCCGRK